MNGNVHLKFALPAFKLMLTGSQSLVLSKVQATTPSFVLLGKGRAHILSHQCEFSERNLIGLKRASC